MPRAQGGEDGLGKDEPRPCPPSPSGERPAPVWKQIAERPDVGRGGEAAFRSAARRLPALPPTVPPPHTGRPGTTAAETILTDQGDVSFSSAQLFQKDPQPGLGCAEGCSAPARTRGPAGGAQGPGCPERASELGTAGHLASLGLLPPAPPNLRPVTVAADGTNGITARRLRSRPFTSYLETGPGAAGPPLYKRDKRTRGVFLEISSHPSNCRADVTRPATPFPTSLSSPSPS